MEIKGLYVILNNYEIAKEVVKGGANIIQLRDKEAHTIELLTLGFKLRKLTKKYNVVFIVNDRVDIAKIVDADGVHLGIFDMPIKYAYRILGNKKIIGASCNNINEARKAQKEGASYISIGPIYKTTTKKDARGTLTPHIISEVKKYVNIPVVAIGGINYDNIDEVIKEGPSAICISSAICNAENVKKETERILKKIIQ